MLWAVDHLRIFQAAGPHHNILVRGPRCLEKKTAPEHSFALRTPVTMIRGRTPGETVVSSQPQTATNDQPRTQ